MQEKLYTQIPDNTTKPIKRSLGKGLAALLGGNFDENINENNLHENDIIRKVLPISFISPNKYNPRTSFDEQNIQELAKSIETHGIIQPIIVRAKDHNSYEIVAGERRWTAAQKAGLHQIPVIILKLDDKKALEVAIIENIQRQDLNPIEEAKGYKKLITEYKYSCSEIANILGKSASYITNATRLLKLPEDIKNMVENNKISAGHARALLAVKDPHNVAERIIKDALNVREVEFIGQQEKNIKQKYSRKRKGHHRLPLQQSEKDTHIIAMEQTLSRKIGLNVEINHFKNQGEIKIQYSNIGQLEVICKHLNKYNI